MSHDRVHELVSQAKELVYDITDKMTLWRAYITIEYAILDVKLRYKLEGELPPKHIKENNPLASVKMILEQIDPSLPDKKKLLYNLRICRDLLKALVAQYPDDTHLRRSTMS